MEDQESNFPCKWCNKRYPCRNSLGVHTRTHVMIQQETTESQELSDVHLKKIQSLNGEKNFELGGGQTNYGLRENPKKTIKAVETITSYPLPNGKVCKQCGKEFQSMKALCGHMAVHSEKDKGMKDDQSWTSENEKIVIDTDDSDTESDDERKLRTKTMEKRYKRFMMNSSFMSICDGTSSVSEIDESEQEDVAMCLMMLSKDSSTWGFSHHSNDAQNEDAEASKKLEYEYDSDSCYYLNEYVKDESDGFVDGFHRIASFFETKKPKVSVEVNDEDTLAKIKKGFNKKKEELRIDKSKESGNAYYHNLDKVLKEPSTKVKKGSVDAEQRKDSHKKRKYECLNCKKVFSSFQALGGHRPCHKRTHYVINEPNNYESDENSLEIENDPYKYDKKFEESHSKKKVISRKVEKTMNSKKNKTHECPYCHRVFKNGQALGGHKRSHFIGGAYVQNRYQAPACKEEQPELLDLNLPAPTEDEDDGSFVSWHVGRVSGMD